MAKKVKRSAKKKSGKAARGRRRDWNAECVARWYGFISAATPAPTAEDRRIAASLRKEDGYSAPATLAPEELARILFNHRDGEWFEKPYAHLFTYRKSPSGVAWARGRETLTLHAIGCASAIADATLIKASYSALHEEGAKDLRVRLSTVGADPRGAFSRELSAFIRKKLGDLSQGGRELAKRHPFAFVAQIGAADERVLDDMPDPLSFAPEEERRRLAEVVEFLEVQQVPYEIDRRIVHDPATSCRICFRIESAGEGLAGGARYDGLAKKLGFKMDLSAAYATVALRKPKSAAASCTFTPEDARFYLLQIGAEAKRGSHLILDTLRKARIPVYQSLDCDKLSTQLGVAKRFEFPYLIVVGAREAREGTVILRDAESRTQELLKLTDLPARLKAVAKGIK